MIGSGDTEYTRDQQQSQQSKQQLQNGLDLSTTEPMSSAFESMSSAFEPMSSALLKREPDTTNLRATHMEKLSIHFEAKDSHRGTLHGLQTEGTRVLLQWHEVV